MNGKLNKKMHVYGFDIHAQSDDRYDVITACSLEFDHIPTAKEIISYISNNIDEFSFINDESNKKWTKSWDDYSIEIWKGRNYILCPCLELILLKKSDKNHDITKDGINYKKIDSVDIFVSNIHRLD